MAHLKLNDDDDKFIQVPGDAVMVFAGASGTESWIERDKDATVRIIIKAVGVATTEGGSLEVCIEVPGGVAKGQDGPSSLDTRLRASQSVQVLVKAGEKLAFKAYPNAAGAAVLRTVVLTADMRPVLAEPEKAPEPSRDQSQPQHA